MRAYTYINISCFFLCIGIQSNDGNYSLDVEADSHVENESSYNALCSALMQIKCKNI